ncbi:hypothetical protein CBR_g30712 [Chara braunii]|uniref:Major facilitator superfamily (MFS) profile domain-containing protein n=1 Tax=Chara braunii TaxID=69332 RepID=A0A388LDQ3_CHABU|nr:hypothetical protein CBR_g30712 [Chara braunii]|eukprot:GBG80343.1 hypothetical protein CBR_g30712 [Chara braunii]
MERIRPAFLCCKGTTQQPAFKICNGIFGRVRGVLSDPLSRTTVLVHVASILESADIVILPAVFLEVRGSIHNISPAKLGTFTFLRCLVEALFSPVAGYLATRYNRVNVIIAGLMSWSLATVGVGMSGSFAEMAVFRALNGIGLSLVVPSMQSILADAYPEEKRGWGFGLNATLGTVGGFVTSSMVTLTAQAVFLGLPCWRLSFFVLAVLGCSLALCMQAFARDPRCIVHVSDYDRLLHEPPDMDVEEVSNPPLPRVITAVATYPASQTTESERLVGGDAREERVRVSGARPAGRAAAAAAEAGEWVAETVQRGNDEEAAQRRTTMASTPLPCTLPPSSDSSSSSSLTTTTITSSAAAYYSINGPTAKFAPSAHCQDDDNTNQHWKEVWGVLAVPTFMVIIAQGVFGTIPGRAMALNTLYYELLFSHSQVASLLVIEGLGRALGQVFGGWVCDYMNRWLPDSGRAMCAQFSLGIKGGGFFLILRVLPRDGDGFFWYALLLFLVGVLGLWNAPGVNDPIMAEIVPERLRTTIYAYDRAFEIAIGSVGAPLAGLLAGVYGFDSSNTGGQGAGKPLVDANANALSKGLTLSITVPCALACVTYSLLYLTYPGDRDRIRASGWGGPGGRSSSHISRRFTY